MDLHNSSDANADGLTMDGWIISLRFDKWMERKLYLKYITYLLNQLGQKKKKNVIKSTKCIHCPLNCLSGMI